MLRLLGERAMGLLRLAWLPLLRPSLGKMNYKEMAGNDEDFLKITVPNKIIL